MNLQLVRPPAAFYEQLFNEDGGMENFYYASKISNVMVNCELRIKDDMVVSGLNFFFGAFQYLMQKEEPTWGELFQEYEGRRISNGTVLKFRLPFAIALQGERIALNLLQKASAISTYTKRFVDLAADKNIKILDTRKTTPGLRQLEKYAVRLGGGFNHRFNQSDLWMIKDNHKNILGGVKGAVEFFKEVGSFYKEIELEVHNPGELLEGRELGIRHFMLDNFSHEEIKNVVQEKLSHETFEVSGGINFETISDYLIDGVDAISIGRLTYGAPPVDISLKYFRD